MQNLEIAPVAEATATKGVLDNSDLLKAPLKQKDWTIKGLSPEVVEISREAARNNGMKINAWVARALSAAANRNPEFDNASHYHDEDVTGYATLSDSEFASHVLDELNTLKVQNKDLIETMNAINKTLVMLFSNHIKD